MTNPNLDALRETALARMDRAERNFKLAVIALLVAESVFTIAYCLMADWRDPLHRLLFVGIGIVYTPLVIGLIALGAHVSRCTLRVLARIDEVDTKP